MRRLMFIFLLILVAGTHLSCISAKITDNEKKLLFTYANVTGFSQRKYLDLSRCESFSKISVFNLVNQYHYTFDSSKSKRNDGYLNITSSLAHYPSANSAKSNMMTEYNSFKIGFQLAGGKKVGLREDDRFFTLGDENRHAFITNRNSTIGHLLVSRIGKNVLQVSIIGLYFNDKGLLEECLGESVRNIQKMK